MATDVIDSAFRSLTQNQIESFRSEGFVVIGKLLEDGHLEELREEYDRIFAEARETQKLRNLSATDGQATTGNGEEMLQIMQDW